MKSSLKFKNILNSTQLNSTQKLHTFEMCLNILKALGKHFINKEK